MNNRRRTTQSNVLLFAYSQRVDTHTHTRTHARTHARVKYKWNRGVRRSPNLRARGPQGPGRGLRVAVSCPGGFQMSVKLTRRRGLDYHRDAGGPARAEEKTDTARTCRKSLRRRERNCHDRVKKGPSMGRGKRRPWRGMTAVATDERKGRITANGFCAGIQRCNQHAITVTAPRR